MTVSTPEAAIHSGPGEDAPVVGTLRFGAKVMTMESADGWTHVIAGGADGYVSSGSLK